MLLLYLQYQEGFSNWTVLSISVADEDDLPARFSTYEYHAFVREDAVVVRLINCAIAILESLVSLCLVDTSLNQAPVLDRHLSGSPSYSSQLPCTGTSLK